MADATALLRLTTWLSPAFPTGGFAWSGGLEAACRDGRVADSDGLRAWCETLLLHGSLHNDAVLLKSVLEDELPAGEADALARALATSPERLDEMVEQGRAFAQAAAPWVPDLGNQHALPVAIALACRAAGIAGSDALVAFLNAAIGQQVQAAQRLAPIGQRVAMGVLAALEPAILAAADRAAQSSLADLGGFAPMLDMAAMNHAALDSRIFRS